MSAVMFGSSVKGLLRFGCRHSWPHPSAAASFRCSCCSRFICSERVFSTLDDSFGCESRVGWDVLSELPPDRAQVDTVQA